MNVQILVQLCSDIRAQKFRGLGPSLSYCMDEKEEKKADRGFIKPYDLLL